MTQNLKIGIEQESWDFSRIIGSLLTRSAKKTPRAYRTSATRAELEELRACLLWELGRELPGGSSLVGLRNNASKEFIRYFPGGALANLAVDMAVHDDFRLPWQLPPAKSEEKPGTPEKPTRRELLIVARDSFRRLVNPNSFGVQEIKDPMSVSVLYTRLGTLFQDEAGKPLKTQPDCRGRVVLEISPGTWTNFTRDAVEADFHDFLSNCTWTPSGKSHKWIQRGIKTRSYCVHLLGLGLLRLTAKLGVHKATLYFKKHYNGNVEDAGINDWEDWRPKCQATMELWFKLFPWVLPKFYSDLPQVLQVSKHKRGVALPNSTSV